MTIAFPRWRGDSSLWMDEDFRDRLRRTPVSAIDERNPPARPAAKPWTAERVAALAPAEARQLLANAESRGDAEIAALCMAALASGSHGRAAPPPTRGAAARQRRLVARSVAFGMCGVALDNPATSRSGVTSHGKVVFALWADDVKRDRDGARCLLWAPNVDGARPWSDTPAGAERLEHCRIAARQGGASGLLVYGTRLQGVQPEQRAATVDGVEPDSAFALRIEKRGEEFWAAWGGRAARRHFEPDPPDERDA